MYIAIETLQNKIDREIGDKTGQIEGSYYLLDFLKTTGRYELSKNSIVNLQVQLIPKEQTIRGLLDITQETNIIILSRYKTKNGQFQLVFSMNQVKFSDRELFLPEISNIKVKAGLSLMTSISLH